MKENNHYLDEYNKNKPSLYGFFLDVVNLLWGTMTKKMPVGKFKWVDKKLTEFLETPDDADQGFFGEVIPHIYMILHKDLPLAAEKLVSAEEMLYEFHLTFPDKQPSTRKLMETLCEKNNYVCHFSMLKFLVSQGLEHCSLNRVLQFDQKKNFKASYRTKDSNETAAWSI